MTARTDGITTTLPSAASRKICHRPLILMVVAMAVGIFGGGTWPGYLPWAMMAVLPVLAALSRAWYRDRPALWAPLLLMALSGYALISPWLPADFPETHISRYTDSRRWHIDGIVAEVLPPRHERSRFIMKVSRLGDGAQSFPVTGRIRVTVSEVRSDLMPNSRVAFTSRIRAFRNFGNPGAFDYRRHMAFQQTFGSAFVTADRVRIVTPDAARHESGLERYRKRARTMIERLDRADTQAIMKALLIGDRQAIWPELRRMFNRCGVGHLLAISGLHIGIVGGLVFGGCLWLLNRFWFILDRGWGRRGATLMSVGPVVFYALLSGLSPATQRALIMVLAFMATYFIFKEGDTLNFLALAAMLMLIWKPPALFSISFQMSFAAVFWIVQGLSESLRKKHSTPDWRSAWWQRIKTFLLVTCWATAGTLPLTMHYFQEVSLIGLAANAFMVPLIGFFVLPVGLLSLFMLSVHEGLAGLGIALAGWGLDQALVLMQAISALDAVSLQTIIPTGLEIVCYYALLGFVAMRPTTRPARWLLLLVLAVIFADALYWGYARFWHRDLRVTIIDVGQGNAALVEFPGGRTMLIDGGGTTDNRYFDVGARIVAPFLRYRKVMQIDTVVLSHPSSDHMNGLVYILANFRPDRLLWTGDKAQTASFRRFYKEALDSGAAIPTWTDTERGMAIGGVKVDILNPPAVATSGPNPGREDYNNRSIVLKLTMDACAILFPGDIEARAETELMACCRPELASSVLVAPHHGSRTSTTSDFLAAVDPKIIVFSVGWMNRFGFPHASVLERCQQRAERIYRTDGQGAIFLRTNGRRWDVKTQIE